MVDALPDEAYFALLTGQADCNLQEDERTECNGYKVYVVSPCGHGTFLCDHHLGVVGDWIGKQEYPTCDECYGYVSSLSMSLIDKVMQ